MGMPAAAVQGAQSQGKGCVPPSDCCHTKGEHARQCSTVDSTESHTLDATSRIRDVDVCLFTCKDDVLIVALAEHMVDSERLGLTVQSYGLRSGLQHVACTVRERGRQQ